MPIDPVVLQRRHTELGRIRLGDKGSKGQPQKLTKFRFTSPTERHINDLATLYGGEPKPWDNKGKAEWEVYSDSKSIPVIVVKGALSQWLEQWSGGGCQRRCTGVTETLKGVPCICDTEKGDRTCKPTTRFGVMLPELEAIGLWRLESHGWNAGSELPPMVELAMNLGPLVPATLLLAERVTISDGKTNRFVVPTLDLGISASRLVALSGVTHTPAAIDGPTAPAITQAPSYNAEIAACGTPDEVRGLWRTIGNNGHLTDTVKAALLARAEEVKPVEATIDEAMTGPGDTGEAFMRVVGAVGVEGWSDAQMRAALEDRFAQPVDDLNAEQLDLFVTELRDGQISVPA